MRSLKAKTSYLKTHVTAMHFLLKTHTIGLSNEVLNIHFGKEAAKISEKGKFGGRK